MDTAYRYWLVQYVPDVARGERVNVAVIVGADGADWAIRIAPDLRRASRLGHDASALRPWLDRLDRTIREYQSPPLDLFASSDETRVTRSWLSLLSHRFNNVLQVGPAIPVAALSAREAVDFLYPVLVATPTPTSRSTTRVRIIRDLAHLYEQTASLELGDNLIRAPKVRAGKQRGRFDFAVVDEQVDQLSHAFAFDVRDVNSLEQELQSWNFVVSRLRSDGAAIEDDLGTLRVSSEVQVAVAYQEPLDQGARFEDVFEAAREAWTNLGVTAVPSSQLDVIARDARDLILATR